MNAVLHLQALVLNLEEEVLFAEEVAIESGGRARRLVLAFRQALGDFAFQASGKPDQPLRMLRQEFLANAWLVVKAAQRSFRRDLHQVAVAFFVFGEHQQMVVSVTVGGSARDDVIVFLANVEFAANNRFDAGLVRCIHEMHGAKNIAVIGHGHRGHAKFLDPINEFLNVASAVEQRVIAVEMQMDELLLAHERLTLGSYQPVAQVRFVTGYAFRHTVSAVIMKEPSGAGFGHRSSPRALSFSGSTSFYWLEEILQ